MNILFEKMIEVYDFQTTLQQHYHDLETLAPKEISIKYVENIIQQCWV